MAPSPQQGTGTNTYVEVVPLTLHIGAEIRGVDLRIDMLRSTRRSVPFEGLLENPLAGE